jgi:hypothetical protein
MRTSQRELSRQLRRVDAQTKLPAAPVPAPQGPLSISDLAKLINDKVAQMVSSARTNLR